MIRKVGRENRKAGAFENRALLKGLHDVVKALVLRGNCEVSCAGRLGEEPGVFELFHARIAWCGLKGKARPKPIQERAPGGDGQLTPHNELVQEGLPIGGKEPHAEMFPALCALVVTMRI